MGESKCEAKGCHERALALSKFCWDHQPDRDSYASSLLKAMNGGRDLAGANLKKVVLKKVNLEKASLAGADLSQADLSGSHFFDVNLSGADLIGANFSCCDLTHTKLTGVDLTKANLAGARLWNASLSGANLTESDLSCADLWNANLYNVKLWHTLFTGTKSLGRSNFTKDVKFIDTASINESGPISAEEAYRDLKQYFLSNGMYNDASWASFKEKTMERLVLKKKGAFTYLPSLIMNILCGYGEKPYRIVLSAISTIGLFALIYFSFGAIERAGDPAYAMRWYDYLYYSTITFTTVGYGDFVPRSHAFFRLLVSAEAFLGIYVTGLFIFTLARKYSAR